MFFSVGVETPKDENTAYGMVVPAFSALGCGCLSAADTQDRIAPMVKEAILLTVECLVESGNFSVEQIQDAGHLIYAANSEYADFDSWFVIDVDLSGFEGNAYSALSDHGLASKFDQCFASIRSTGML